MKCNLTLGSGGICLEIEPESDVEAIALHAWSDKFFPIEQGKGAFLLILAKAPNTVCTGQEPTTVARVCDHGYKVACPRGCL